MTESESHAFEIATYSEHINNNNNNNVMTGTQLKRLDNTGKKMNVSNLIYFSSLCCN